MLVCENQHPRFVSLIYKCPVNKQFSNPNFKVIWPYCLEAFNGG